jgi:hypothetical protein
MIRQLVKYQQQHESGLSYQAHVDRVSSIPQGR